MQNYSAACCFSIRATRKKIKKINKRRAGRADRPRKVPRTFPVERGRGHGVINYPARHDRPPVVKSSIGARDKAMDRQTNLVTRPAGGGGRVKTFGSNARRESRNAGGHGSGHLPGPPSPATKTSPTVTLSAPRRGRDPSRDGAAVALVGY